MIGIIGAMTVEADGLKDLMTGVRTEQVGSIQFTIGELKGKSCVVAVCGIGKVNAAMCAQTMILKYAPSVIINTGVAGGIGKNIAIGDIVVAQDVVQHDMDTSGVGDPKGFISGIDLIHIPCSKYLTEKILAAANKMPHVAFHVGTIVTGDQFINDKVVLNGLMHDFGGVACEMEGGAIGQVCYSNHVDFAIVRAISDNANEDAHMDYPKFVAIAAKQSIAFITELVPTL